MGDDVRPAGCRFRLQDEGKSYPRSSCQACGRSIATGLGKRCYVEAEAFAALSDPNAVHVNMLRGAIAKPSWAQITHIYAQEYAAAIASARAQALEEAAGECHRLAESYTRALATYSEDQAEMGKVKWAAAAVTVAGENIRALSARPDTAGPVIEAAKAVVAAMIAAADRGYTGAAISPVADATCDLAAAIAAHEGRHG